MLGIVMLEDAKHMLQDWLAWPQHDEASFVPVVLRGILKTPGKIGGQFKHVA